MIEKFGDWKKYGDMLQKAGHKTDDYLKKALAKQSLKLASDIKRNITSGGRFAGKPFEPLKPSTIARKGSSKPLIDTGDMRNSVMANKLNDYSFLVGISGDVRGGKDKKSIADYARMHEFGGITEKGILIPARPFIEPTVDKTKGERIKEIQEDMRKLFK